MTIVLSNLLSSLADVLGLVITVFYWLIFLRAIISWVNPDPYNSLVIFLRRCTEPVLSPLRRIVPPVGGIDISPLIAFLILIFLKGFLVRTLLELAYRIR